MRIAKIGGPAYRIGLGGGSASSRGTAQGTNDQHLDTRAVQRGDAEMGNKLARVVRACSELANTTILSIHDQGAGGNANVLKELVAPTGAVIDAAAFPLGDNSLSILELWASEYQENHGVIVSDEGFEVLKKICDREGLPVATVGRVDNSGRMKLIYPPREDQNHFDISKTAENLEQRVAVDLPLEEVLEVPRRNYQLDDRTKPVASSFLPEDLVKVPTPEKALMKVLKLVSVGSKRFLTSKVDRSVGGLVACTALCGAFPDPSWKYRSERPRVSWKAGSGNCSG